MKFLNLSFICMSLLFINTINSMDKEKFKKGTIVKVVKGPEKYRNKIMIIKGTTKEIWGIEDVDGSPDAFKYNPLYRYIMTDHPDNGGTVYYARYADNLLKDCVHESWIEKDESFDRDDIVVSASGGPSVDGGYYMIYHTAKDVKNEEMARRQAESSITPEQNESQKPTDETSICIVI